MVSCIVVGLMCVWVCGCSGAILEGNRFPVRLSEGGNFSKVTSSLLLLSENHHMKPWQARKKEKPQNRAKTLVKKNTFYTAVIFKVKFPTVLLPSPHLPSSAPRSFVQYQN